MPLINSLGIWSVHAGLHSLRLYALLDEEETCQAPRRPSPCIAVLF